MPLVCRSLQPSLPPPPCSRPSRPEGIRRVQRRRAAQGEWSSAATEAAEAAPPPPASVAETESEEAEVARPAGAPGPILFEYGEESEEGSSGAGYTSSAHPRADYSLFVRFLHLASPYVVGHRGRTFVVVIPGEVLINKELLYPLLEDILLLHGLGIRLALVCGARPQIDAYLAARGLRKQMVGAYRVTDRATLEGALEAAATTATEVAALLSKAPSLPMVRRHARGDGQQMHFAPPVQVMSGNYVTAKRRGVVGDVDFQYMGQVRFVQADAVNQQLQAGAIVLLTNVGVSASGELLNCNTYDIATHAAVELKADKLICLTGQDVRELNLPQYLPLEDALAMIQEATTECTATGRRKFEPQLEANEPSSSGRSSSGGYSSNGSYGTNGGGNGNRLEMSLDLDSWQQIGFPPAVLAAVVACRHGVTRAHLVDERADGALLLELYTRDGTEGVCMIAGDIYQGIRVAEQRDLTAVSSLLSLLATTHGVELPFPSSQLSSRLEDVTVIEREGKILGCCCITDHGLVGEGAEQSYAEQFEAESTAAAAAAMGPSSNGDRGPSSNGDRGAPATGGGERVAEVAAFVVHPSYRCVGFGDSLLDYVEQAIRLRGFTRLVIVAGQGSFEWFIQRDFVPAGDAAAVAALLPAHRRTQLAGQAPPAKVFAKEIMAPAPNAAPAGKRIGF